MTTDPTFPRVAIIDIPGKGKGVVANEYIRRGTLIVSEKPRILIPDGPAGLRVLASMSQEDTAFLLSFPGVSDHGMLERFKHFTPCVGDDAWGLCPTVCRVNHTCRSSLGSPNAAYFWNVNTKEEELRALKEIHEGQEIEVSYMEDIANYSDPRAHLKLKYGFICSCRGCTRPTAEKKSSTQRILTYNDFVRDLPGRFGPENPLQILEDIERQMIVVCEEGYTGEIGPRAHDAFQLCAYYGDAASGKQWEALCRDCHGLYQGPKSQEFKKSAKLAAKPETFRAWKQLGRRNLKGPSEQVLAYCNPTIEPPRSLPNVVSSGAGSSLGSTSTSTTTIRDPDAPATRSTTTVSKGQKKKAKARAKKEAAQEKATDSGEQAPM
ncbi:hypothetical protein C8J57DRAFT_1131344 [Mycena rebaudengoi]|nr:hypothetical protein C8J57DRAFT_1131344 [Mycena rebaudengoi]